MLKTLTHWLAAVMSAAIVVSCASGAPEEERPAAVELAQSLECQLVGSDGNKCTTTSRTTGICAGGVCCVCADLKERRCLNCDDRNSCTKDTCENYTTCVNTPLADETQCSGGLCAGGRCCTQCVDKEGTCRTNGSGEPPFCGLGGVACDVCADDGNPCTDDICTAKGTCEHVPRQDGVSCEDDGDVCNGTSSCKEGKCVEGTPLNCTSDNVCKTSRCDRTLGCVSEDNDDPCQDGNPCTINDRCRGGVCQAGEDADCDDNEFCTDDSCDSKTGCVHAPKEVDTPCDDRNACTTASACNSAGRCVPGPGQLSCDDADPCTINGCNPTLNTCDYSVRERENTPCVPANDKCILNAVCNAAGDCAGGVEKDCNDDNPCTADGCDPRTGECTTRDLDGDPCSDGSACSVNDRCERGSCVGDAVECTASDDCHDPGRCDEATGLCTDLRKANGVDCESGTGTCAQGNCVPNPTAGAGGGPADGEGGAPPTDGGAPTSNGGEPALGGAAFSGRGGTSGGAEGGEDGSDDDSERGPPFVRKRGGCSTSAGGAPGGTFALGLLASVIALATRRRSLRRNRCPASGGDAR